MDVIVPLRVKRIRRARGPQIARFVGSVLQHQVEVPFCPGPLANLARELRENMHSAVILDGVDGIEPQAVEAIFLEPEQGVVNEEVADRAAGAAVEVDRIAPRRLVPIGEELAGVGVEIVPLRAKVVVDHVEHHRDAAPVRGIDQGLELVRCSVRRLRREREHAVVPPAAGSREIGYRHELDHRDAQLREVLELRFGS